MRQWRTKWVFHGEPCLDISFDGLGLGWWTIFFHDFKDGPVTIDEAVARLVGYAHGRYLITITPEEQAELRTILERRKAEHRLGLSHE